MDCLLAASIFGAFPIGRAETSLWSCQDGYELEWIWYYVKFSDVFKCPADAGGAKKSMATERGLCLQHTRPSAYAVVNVLEPAAGSCCNINARLHTC